MTERLCVLTPMLTERDSDRNQRVKHDGFVHDLFGSMPWLAWILAALLVVVVLLSLVGKLLGRVFSGTPWWVRLGLLGALFYTWREKRTQAAEDEYQRYEAEEQRYSRWR